MGIAYRNYWVEVLDEQEALQEVVQVRAWSKVGAVEKVDKKVNGTGVYRYRVNTMPIQPTK